MCNATHLLLVIEKERCDETAFHQMGLNVTHPLFKVIGKDVMKLPSTNIFNVAYIL
jgi:hypothetical protein